MSRRTSKKRRIVPNMFSFLPAEGSACVRLHPLSLTKRGITEEDLDGSLVGYPKPLLSKFHALDH